MGGFCSSRKAENIRKTKKKILQVESHGWKNMKIVIILVLAMEKYLQLYEKIEKKL